MQDGINVQGDFFLKINKHADQNKAVQGGIFLSKLINVQENNNKLNVQGEIFLKINKHACKSIRYTRVLGLLCRIKTQNA